MFSFGQSSRVGVSISDSSIEMMEVRIRRDRKIEVLAASAVALESGVVERGRVVDVDRLSRALKTAHAAAAPASFSLQTLDIALPDSVTYFHTFRFPGSLTNAEIANALQFQTEEVFPYPSDELVSDFIVSSRTAQETVVQYAVADKEAIAGYAAAASRAGFSVGGLGLEAQAIARALLAAPRKGKASLVADLGEYTSTLFLRDANGLIATFSTTIAGAMLTQALMAHMGVPREKAETLKRKSGLGEGADKRAQQAIQQSLQSLVKHLSDIIGWYERMTGNQVDDVVLTGGTSLLEGLPAYLSEELGSMYPNARVRVGDTFAAIQDAPAVRVLQKDKRGAFYAPALGAAVLAAGKEKSFEFFGPSKRVRRQVSRAPTRVALPVNREQWHEFIQSVPQRTKMVFAGVLLLLACMVLLAAVLWRIQKEAEVTAQIDAMQDRESTSEEAIGPLTSEVAFTIGLEPGEADIGARAVVANVVRTHEITPAEAVLVDGIASGIVTLVNDSTTDQALVATTRLLSENGVLFRLRTNVTVPAQGSAQAEAYADVAGATGDIAPTTFTIPGLPVARQQEVYARSDAPMSGGVSMAGVLTDGDIEAAKSAAVADALADLDAVITVLESDVLFPELAHIDVQEATSDVPVGTNTGTVVVTVRMAVTAWVVPQSDWNRFLSGSIAETAGVDMSVVEETGTIEYTSMKIMPWSPDETVVEGTVQAVFTPYGS